MTVLKVVDKKKKKYSFLSLYIPIKKRIARNTLSD